MILSSFWRRVLGMSDKPKIVDALGAATAAQGLLAASALQRTDIIYGSNANGQYWRVPDSSGSGGLQICANNNLSLTFANASNLLATWTFPATFAAAPLVQSQMLLNTYSAKFYGGPRDYARSVTTSQAVVGVASAATFVSGDEAINVMQAVAIGRYT